MHLFKLLPAQEWRDAEATGLFTGSAVDVADGFIHFSTAEQLAETAQKYFAGLPDIVLLTVDAAALGEALRWEPSRGGSLFPHLYGALLREAIVKVESFDTGAR